MELFNEGKTQTMLYYMQQDTPHDVRPILNTAINSKQRRILL